MVLFQHKIKQQQRRAKMLFEKRKWGLLRSKIKNWGFWIECRALLTGYIWMYCSTRSKNSNVAPKSANFSLLCRALCLGMRTLLCVCVCVCVFVYVSKMFIYISIYLYSRTNVSPRWRVNMYVYINICTCAYINTQIYTRAYLYIFIYLPLSHSWAYVHVCTYKYLVWGGYN